MIVKAFEIRDAGTFIPAIGVLMLGGEDVAETYLLRRAGFGAAPPYCVILCRMECDGIDRNATYDPFAWGQNPRTMHVAHRYIEQHWKELENGAVICVETILGERQTPKVSERITT